MREARFILLWPLTLHLSGRNCEARAMADAVRDVAEALRRREQKQTTRWRHQPDPLHHIPMPSKAEEVAAWKNAAYAETVYFHEFVQSFLFRKQADGRDAPFHLFQRDDLRFADVTIGTKNGATDKRLTVERLNLYLFRTGVAILVLELWAPPGADGTSGWTLAQVQDFHDYFRRVYAPFFVKPDPERPGNEAVREVCNLVPRLVTWIGENGTVLCRRTRDDACEVGAWHCADAIGDVEALVDRPDEADGRRRPPIFKHWRFLLDDALLLAGQDAGRDTARWHQVVDERMPSLATVSVTPVVNGKPVSDEIAAAVFKMIPDGDLMRLCFADASGSTDYPYDKVFLDWSFWTENAYTRFRDRGTLYLFSGYAFVAIGAGGFFDGVLMEHVRRHYFQMGLLAHFELASLLAFSSQISRAVGRLDREADRAIFEREMAVIEEQFLQFVHRFRFTGVSNQIQAREMFGLWRQRLGLDTLFADVQNEIHTANAFLASRTQSRTSAAATRLSQVATVGVVLGLAFGALGMNVIFSDEGLEAIVNGQRIDRVQVAIAFSVIALFQFAGWGVMRLLRGERPDVEQKDPLEYLVLGFGCMALLLAAVAWVTR
ncbi:MAG: hypothetical protein HZA68_16410 [Rhodovulum sp.]|nr:hypothetical protein [Rhodovulum sp.]